jgi:two-component system, probable response regulator PhcQ
VSLCVLFVDDDPALLRALLRGLRNEKELQMITASNADEALSILRKHSVDVIVSDIDMPGITGLELLSIVRREHPSVLRMMITGEATTERALAAINEGEVARFFVKPFTVKAMRDTLMSFRDRVDRVRRETIAQRESARAEALRAWAEKTFPGVTEIAHDSRGEMIVDRTADDLVFGPKVR